ncbi:MAG: Hsp70 family protein, partial [Pirellulaceae bacterium]|nr:Hsp70 family protein [Pirellulaceae bacterium]
MASHYPVGIDLGTTFSAAAWVDDSGRTEMIRNAEGELLTPSVVLFDDRELVVGKEARSATIVHPDMVAEWVKRDMGLPYYS